VKPVGRHWSPVTGAHSTRHLVATERGIGLPPSTWEQPPQCPRARVDQAVSTGHGSLERSSLKRPSLRSVRSPGPGRAKLARVPTERNSSLPYGIVKGSDKGSDRLSVQGGWGPYSTYIAKLLAPNHQTRVRTHARVLSVARPLLAACRAACCSPPAVACRRAACPRRPPLLACLLACRVVW
jgi:hypothetical protein